MYDIKITSGLKKKKKNNPGVRKKYIQQPDL